MTISKQSTIVLAAIILFATCIPALTQSHPNDKDVSKEDGRTTEMKQKLQDAAQKGFVLSTKTNVSQSTSIQSVLIPASLARRIFGREVSQNYAVVELIVSNEDEKASLVIHSVFLDYSKWLLSGTSRTAAAAPTGTSFQAFNKLSQVASIESRLVRGEMLDAQQWTARNWTIRSLTAVGSIAGAFAFPFSGDVAKGIAAFNGEVVPGASTLWPDGTVNQINRVSDFGFQTNKIIAKQGSDIIVAFFPIDRFLTPGFKEVFLKDPAALFVPSEMLADPKTKKYFEAFVKPWAETFSAPCTANCSNASTNNSASTATGLDFEGSMRRAMLEDNCGYSSDGVDTNNKSDTNMADKSSDISGNQGSGNHENLCKLQTLLNEVSLNNIRVGLEGAMTVDVNTIPATIYDVQFDSGNTDTSIWTKTDTSQTGTITGVYLTGGEPAVVDSKGVAYSDITVTSTSEGSTDTELHFTLKISKCIPSSSKIYFVVNKKSDQSDTDKSQTKSKTTTAKAKNSSKTSGDSVASTPFEFPLPVYVCPSPNN